MFFRYFGYQISYIGYMITDSGQQISVAKVRKKKSNMQEFIAEKNHKMLFLLNSHKIIGEF